MRRIKRLILCIAVGVSLTSCGDKKADKEFMNIHADSEPTASVSTPVSDPIIASEKVAESAEPVATEDSSVRNHKRIHINALGRLSEVFNDSNYQQYVYAEALGIEPIRSVRQAYHTRRPILKITSNKYYEVDTLKHSLPYLVPEASNLLTDIGRRFIDSLAARGADGYRIKVTSLLRTPYTVKRLRRVNVNATDSSTHQFGTTFDLSYTHFHCLDERRTVNEEDLKNLLAEVLYAERAEGRCLVKYERLTGCFHITATK